MFRDCELLTSLDLSHLDTSLVTDMSYMFSNCNSLIELKIEFNTEKVHYMNSMFNSCSQLKELNICSFNTQFCNNFDHIFDGCKLELYLNEKNCSNLIEKNPSNINYHDVGMNL